VAKATSSGFSKHTDRAYSCIVKFNSRNYFVVCVASLISPGLVAICYLGYFDLRAFFVRFKELFAKFVNIFIRLNDPFIKFRDLFRGRYIRCILIAVFVYESPTRGPALMQPLVANNGYSVS